MSGDAAANQSGNASGQAAGAQGAQQQSGTGNQSGQQGQQASGQQQQGDQTGQQQGQQGQQQQGAQQGQQQGAQQQGNPQQGAQQQGQQGAQQQSQVPDRYELRLPDQSPLDQTDVEAITKIAKDKGWSNEQAQGALAEMHSTLVAQTQGFRTELDADREVGGAQLEVAQVKAKAVLDRFLPESEPDGVRLRAAINKSGYGNWVPLVKLLARIGKAMGEDQPFAGAQGQRQQTTVRSQADRLFGDAQGVQK
jgi:hypothetical protein